MVTRGAYFDDDEQSFRRYSVNRGHNYPLNQDRELPPALHHAPYGRQHMSSQNRQSPEQDNNSQPRRRIPVACGRCRKRKIKCSGDPGNNQGCSNCKSAGNDSCQFLRVSSTEAQMKNNDVVADFGYESAGPRGHCRMSPFGPQQQQQSYPHVTSLSSDGYSSYRQNSLSAYQKPFLFYPTTPSYGEFADENGEYGMPPINYPVINHEPMYSTGGNIRGWSPTAQVQKSSALFVEQDSPYNPDLWSGLKQSFPMRPQISPEVKDQFSLTQMSIALPNPMNGTDRVLPFPASSRSIQVGPSYLRPTESPLPMTQPHPSMQFNNTGLMNANAGKELNTSAVSVNAGISPYMPLSSSPESIPSFHQGSTSHSVASSSRVPEDYTPNSDTRHHSMFPHNNNSSEDLRYSTSPGLQRGSLAGEESRDNPQSGANNLRGALPDTQYYRPLPPTQPSYATPPMLDPSNSQTLPSEMQISDAQRTRVSISAT